MYKVVYNACYGGFNLSREASEYLNNKYSLGIEPEYGTIDEDLLPRHDPRLIEVIELMGNEANGFCAKLKIATIESQLYRIDEYDGWETVETPDGIDWIIINT